MPTVYPPLALVLFILSGWLPAPVLGLKSLLAALDLGSCAMLWLLAKRWRLPTERSVWFAWNPLLTVEVAGMGHIDGLGIALVILTTVLLVQRPQRFLGAALSATGAVLSKLVPVLAAPTWGRLSRQSWLFVILVMLLSTTGLVPMMVGTAGAPPGLVRYGVSWEFNHIYPLNYPQLWAKGVLAIGLALALLWAWRTPDTVASLRRVFGSAILFSATVYPWYALWVLPWAALDRSKPWLTLSGLLFLSYIPQVLDVPLFPWLFGAIWLPFALMAARYR